MPFTTITILYNPQSTGPSEAMARELRRELAKVVPQQKVTLLATKRAGHAEELAYQLAKASARPLIISASGDGGYHEVINGLVKAQQEGAHPTAGLLPAGNANDHFQNVHDTEITKAIQHGTVQTIDLLKLTSKVGGKSFERYAHSYIGVGLTPKVGQALNEKKLNPINEIGIVLRALLSLYPVRLKVGGKKRTYDSLIFSNIPRMSKVLNLSESAEPDDGQFEVTAFTRRHKLALIAVLLRATTVGLKGSHHVRKYDFETLRPLLTQLDGEVYKLDAHTPVSITLAPHYLTCIV